MENSEKEKINYIIQFLKGIALSFLITIGLIYILSLLLCKSDLNENIINPSIIFISSFSVLTGGFCITRKANKNGIVLGGILGLIYIVIIYLISSILNSNFSLNLNSITLILSTILCGCVGGIIGINLKNK